MFSKSEFKIQEAKRKIEKYSKGKRFKGIAAAFLCLILAIGVSTAYLLGKSKVHETDEKYYGLDELTNAKFEGAKRENDANGAGTSIPEKVWVLYITGAVKSPGVYKLPEGSRVYELVAEAGGLTEKADSVAVNLAANLKDGCHVHVPEKGEHVPLTLSEQKGAVFIDQKGKLEPSKIDGATFEDYHGSSDLIDLNSATAEMLQSLPGIGSKTAQAILSYREDKGGFRSVEELLEVKGIGPKKMGKIRPLITVGYR
ncbi:helix-hairpin-helix domain-containing protein [Acetomicrobium hydrogeniformans]|uniref:Helix-hairpin-helix DNA-binding motif class 1 domain-containing protein n=1 Tax=Acetomicrobium hydrogeniformans TaxID=649746 RepID=A0A7V6ZCV9_9BACT|nr:helix-hairpin-helix domain-containing protein [Acetomicrobium hydrogeniformans]HHZ03513.1 hypothetical protein [Acetomicrobium hydrogeniformans]